MPEVLAVVPARGGSKGLPGKNVMILDGRPLVAWAVAAALAARSVGRVVGSTDDPAIAEALRAAGAEVPFLRPPDLALDSTRDAPVFLHVLDMLSLDGYRPDIVVNVRPTAPLRTGPDIDAAVAILVGRPECRSVKSVSVCGEHPYKMWLLDGDEPLRPLLPEWHTRYGGEVDLPRQALPPVYRSNGAVDAVRVDALRETGTFHPGPIAAFVLDPARSIDIDTADDLLLVERHLREVRA